MKLSEVQSLLNEQYTLINNLKNKLAKTDYVVIRAQEQGLSLDESFKAERQSWRDEINACDAEIARLNAIEVETETIPEVEE